MSISRKAPTPDHYFISFDFLQPNWVECLCIIYTRLAAVSESMVSLRWCSWLKPLNNRIAGITSLEQSAATHTSSYSSAHELAESESSKFNQRRQWLQLSTFQNQDCFIQFIVFVKAKRTCIVNELMSHSIIRNINTDITTAVSITTASIRDTCWTEAWNVGNKWLCVMLVLLQSAYHTNYRCIYVPPPLSTMTKLKSIITNQEE